MKKFFIVFILLFALINLSLAQSEKKVDSLSTSKSNIPNIIPLYEPIIGSYKILPTDESHQDASLVKFIENLKKCIQYKDTSELFSIIDTAIVLSYGGLQIGKKVFSKEWNLDSPENSSLWDILKEKIRLGGTFESDGENKYFQFPYAISNKAFRKLNLFLDPYFSLVCISSDAKVFIQPDTNSNRIGLLNYDIVRRDINYRGTGFIKIFSLDNKITGFALSSDFIGIADRKLIIKKDKNGTWRITSFAPFD